MGKRDDFLWKAVLEDVFEEFLRFFFSGAENLFDMKRGFVYLDKEFDKLFPPEEGAAGIRFVDKLVKVFLNNGSEKFILVHVEIQGQKSKEDLKFRMFRYFYLIKDKYNVSITALAILTDKVKSFRPKVYVEEYLGTKLTYEFNVYKLLDQNEEKFRDNPNPFSVVILVALLAIKHKKMDDQDLMDMKLDLIRELIKRKVSKAKQRSIMNFLKFYVNFDDPDMMRNFEEATEQLTGRITTMGTQEYLEQKFMKQGLQKGLQKGLQQGLQKGLQQGLKEGLKEGKEAGRHEEALEIARELKREGLALGFISKTTKISIDEIEKIQL